MNDINAHDDDNGASGGEGDLRRAGMGQPFFSE